MDVVQIYFWILKIQPVAWLVVWNHSGKQTYDLTTAVALGILEMICGTSSWTV